MEKDLLKLAATRHKGDILAPYDAIIDCDGFDAVCAFCDLLGGATVYVPKKRNVFQFCLNEEIRSEYNGYNIKALVQKYGFSESYVRKLLRG
ncbi:MAG: hypothetical protein FWF03_08845 [Defluviitaleaceae bacterium]|nr:hypothetical protein [Defluviitaleaceae bacterium]